MAGSVARSPLPILFYVLAAAAAVAVAQTSNVTSDEEYWEKRAEEARSYNRAAYVSDPIATLNRFNKDVLRVTTRRSLAKYKGPCMATNPIDRCWRCRDDWAKDRKRLAQCVMGFGHTTLGGVNGKFYVVTDASDDEMIMPKKGTLRYGVVQDRPLWIVFARNMIINLRQELIVNHNKTIDGRGAQVHITGAQITVQGVKHVIIHNVHIHHSVPHSGGMIRDSKHHYGFRSRSDGDGISILESSNIWIDHVSMWNCSDGLIDVVNGSTAITISNGHFTKHDHVDTFPEPDYTRQSRRTYLLGADQIQSLKQRILQQSKAAKNAPLEPPTTYVAISSLVWTSIVRAKPLDHADDAYFMFAADCRRRLCPPVDDGFFGGCVKSCYARATVGDLCGDVDGLAHAASAVRRAIREYLENPLGDADRWIENYQGLPRERSAQMGSSHRFMAYEIDFGWGEPSRVELVSVFSREIVMLVGARGGAVQVSVALDRECIDAFEANFLSQVSA